MGCTEFSFVIAIEYTLNPMQPIFVIKIAVAIASCKHPLTIKEVTHPEIVFSKHYLSHTLFLPKGGYTSVKVTIVELK